MLATSISASRSAHLANYPPLRALQSTQVICCLPICLSNTMDAPKPTMTRQTSGMKNIPSFNDFGSMAAEDVDVAPAPRMSVSVPKPSMLHRGWSIESSSPPSSRSLSTPMSSSFSETFTRALYEHMRGN